MENNIILYTTHCPMCKIIERDLVQKGIKYTEITDVNLMTEKGFTSVPMLEVDGVIMNFGETRKWLRKGGNV